MGIAPHPNQLQIVIDKGTGAGVYVGQAVLDSEGLFGQVVSVDRFTAHVLLLTDRLHALPVEVNRTGVRGIAAGTGQVDQLRLEDIPTTADVREGDLMVSSGLGGRFPRGYPVGKVTSVLIEPGAATSVVVAQPTAQLDRSRHVLLVFPAAQTEEPQASPEALVAEPVEALTEEPSGTMDDEVTP